MGRQRFTLAQAQSTTGLTERHEKERERRDDKKEGRQEGGEEGQEARSKIRGEKKGGGEGSEIPKERHSKGDIQRRDKQHNGEKRSGGSGVGQDNTGGDTESRPSGDKWRRKRTATTSAPQRQQSRGDKHSK